ncbi:MAG: glycosyltransferase [Variovorax sp.]
MSRIQAIGLPITRSARVAMIGVIIPAHDEEAYIDAALERMARAVRHPALHGEAVEVLVVLDSCRDATAKRVAARGVRSIRVDARNVGAARSAGADRLLAEGARWLAFTDADSEVSKRWLVEQLALQCDVVCGSIGVDDWTPHGIHANLLHLHFLETYNDSEGHRHIHGANLGVSAAAYRLAGGFQSHVTGEDVAFVAALQAVGASIAWSAKPRVVTSARRVARAPSGFAAALTDAVAARLAAQAA